MNEERPPTGGPEQPGPPPGGPQPPDRPVSPQPLGRPPPPPLPPAPGVYSTYGAAGPIPEIRGGVAPRLREMRVGELLDAAINLYRRNWKTFMGIVAFVLVPVNLLQAFLTRTVGGQITSPEEIGVGPDGGALVATIIVGAATFLFIVPFLTAAIARATSEIYLGGSPGVGEIYRFALGRTRSILWVSLLSALVIVLGLVALVIPGIIFFIRYQFSTSIVVVEGQRGTKAMGRSWRLAKGYFWKILGLTILAGILTSIVGAILVIPLEIAANAIGESGWVLRGVGQSAAGIVTRPYQGILIVLLYFDMRIRKEGFDLALMAQELQRHET